MNRFLRYILICVIASVMPVSALDDDKVTYGGMGGRFLHGSLLPPPSGYINYANLGEGVWSNSIFILPFVETSGGEITNHGNLYSASATNGAGALASTPWNHYGASANWRVFNTANTIVVPDDDLLTPTSMSYVVWMNTGTWTKYLMEKRNEYRLKLLSGGFYIQLEDDDTSGYIRKYSANAEILNDNKPVMLAFTWTGLKNWTGLKCYVNGVESDGSGTSSGTFTGIANTAYDLEIGSRYSHDPAYGFGGYMSYPMMFNAGLSSNQIYTIYQNTRWNHLQNIYNGTWYAGGHGWTPWDVQYPELADYCVLRTTLNTRFTSFNRPVTIKHNNVNNFNWQAGSPNGFTDGWTNNAGYMNGTKPGFYNMNTFDNMIPHGQGKQGFVSFWTFISAETTGSTFVARSFSTGVNHPVIQGGGSLNSMWFSCSGTNTHVTSWTLVTEADYMKAYEDRWVNVFVNHNSTQASMYVNGVYATNQYFNIDVNRQPWFDAVNVDTGIDWHWGMSSWISTFSSFHRGWMSDLMIGTNPFTPAQIQTYYETEATNMPVGL